MSFSLADRDASPSPAESGQPSAGGSQFTKESILAVTLTDVAYAPMPAVHEHLRDLARPCLEADPLKFATVPIVAIFSLKSAATAVHSP